MITYTPIPSRLSVSLFFLLGTLVGCEKINLSKLPTSPESAVEFVAENSELPTKILDPLACQAYDSEVAPYKENGEIVTDEKILVQIQDIQNALIEAAKRSERFSDVANEFTWQLAVINDKEKKKNAFAVPCGGVGVHTGIFAVAKQEAGLAAILAHEDAHALARHAQKRMSKKVMTALGSAVVAGGGAGAGLSFTDLDPGLKAGISVGVGLAGGAVGAVASDYIFQPEMEYEADKEGLFLAADAGYDPALMLAFWRNLKEHEADANKNYAFLKLHPIGEDRYKELLKHQEQAEEIYEQAKKKERVQKPKLLPGVSPTG